MNKLGSTCHAQPADQRFTLMGWEAHPDSNPQKIERKNPTKPGWWFQPLWKIWKSVGIIIPNIWKNNPNVPNHKPEINGNSPVLSFWVVLSVQHTIYDKRDTTKSSKGSLVDWHSAQLMRTMTCHTWPTCPLSQEFQNACPVPISKRSWGPWTVLNENHLSLWYCTQTRFAGFFSIYFDSFPFFSQLEISKEIYSRQCLNNGG